MNKHIEINVLIFIIILCIIITFIIWSYLHWNLCVYNNLLMCTFTYWIALLTKLVFQPIKLKCRTSHFNALPFGTTIQKLHNRTNQCKSSRTFYTLATFAWDSIVCDTTPTNRQYSKCNPCQKLEENALWDRDVKIKLRSENKCKVLWRLRTKLNFNHLYYTYMPCKISSK